MNLASNTAVIIVLFVTFLWGSWFQAVKHTGNYPIAGFISWMYTFSVIIVGISVVFLQDSMIPNGFIEEVSRNIPLSVFLLACGVVFAAAMQMHLAVVGRIGLILSTSVSATCCILCGTLVSSFFGGIPEGASFASIFLASLLLVLATVICQYAGVRRDREIKKCEEEVKGSRGYDIVLLIFINAVLMSSYPLATSVGIQSPLNPEGMSSLTCMGLLAAGAFVGAQIFMVIEVRRKKQKEAFRRPDKGYGKILLMAFIAACCHFGGNVLHAAAVPVISAAIATAMGNSYHVWSYIWGIFYGEFKGASLKTYLLLGGGVLLFIMGVLILSFNIT